MVGGHAKTCETKIGENWIRLNWDQILKNQVFAFGLQAWQVLNDSGYVEGLGVRKYRKLLRLIKRVSINMIWFSTLVRLR